MRSETSDGGPLPGIDCSANMMPLLLATLYRRPIKNGDQGNRQAGAVQLLDGDAQREYCKACSCASRLAGVGGDRLLLGPTNC